MNLPIRRRLRHVLARLVPERVKAPLRARLFGYRAPNADLPVAFASDHLGSFIVIAGRVRLRFRDEDQGDIRYYFVENGDSVEEMASFIALAGAAETFFDVGAAKGLFSQVFCLLGADKRAIAFEPSATANADADVLANANGCRSRIMMRPVAVGREAGARPARRSPGGFVNVDAEESAGEAIDAVRLTSLDDEVRSLGFTPDLIKIDVEGYEYEVLLGARRLLRERKPPICLELHLDLLERRGQSGERVLAELGAHGYRFQSCAGRPLSAAQIYGSMNAVLRFVAI